MSGGGVGPVTTEEVGARLRSRENRIKLPVEQARPSPGRLGVRPVRAAIVGVALVALDARPAGQAAEAVGNAGFG
jgi:hypothetical protein